MEQKPQQKQQKPAYQAPIVPQVQHDKDFRHLVRIANTDLDGNKPISSALRKIKGIGFMFSNAVCTIADIQATKKTGVLKEEEIARIEAVLKNPVGKMPDWMFNRRKDYETGENKHLLTGELTFTNENDIRRMKKIKSYKGIRHMLNLPVRGQKMRSNFRKNKGKVMGVKRSSGMKKGGKT